MNSMAWHCGFCDSYYKNTPIWEIPKWMNEEEVRDWKRGWKVARSL